MTHAYIFVTLCLIERRRARGLSYTINLQIFFRGVVFLTVRHGPGSLKVHSRFQNGTGSPGRLDIAQSVFNAVMCLKIGHHHQLSMK